MKETSRSEWRNSRTSSCYFLYSIFSAHSVDQYHRIWARAKRDSDWIVFPILPQFNNNILYTHVYKERDFLHSPCIILLMTERTRCCWWHNLVRTHTHHGSCDILLRRRRYLDSSFVSQCERALSSSLCVCVAIREEPKKLSRCRFVLAYLYLARARRPDNSLFLLFLVSYFRLFFFFLSLYISKLRLSLFHVLFHRTITK